ncbi:MAG: hypothetical protein AAGF75_03750 [Cyanobacteria bacterium P01_H01_bin.130]
MAPSMDYNQEYQRAHSAYVQGDYTAAAEIIDRLVVAEPGDANARLLRGHIYCYGLQQYGVAQDDYQAVLTLTTDSSFLEYAQTGLQDVAQGLGQGDPAMNGSNGSGETGDAQFADFDFEETGAKSGAAVESPASPGSGESSEGFGIASLDDLELGEDVDTGLSLGQLGAAEEMGGVGLAELSGGPELEDPLQGLTGANEGAEDPFAAIAGTEEAASMDLGGLEGDDPFASMDATDAMGMGTETSVASSSDVGFPEDPFGGGDADGAIAGGDSAGMADGGEDPFGLGAPMEEDLGAAAIADLGDGDGDPFGLGES